MWARLLFFFLDSGLCWLVLSYTVRVRVAFHNIIVIITAGKAFHMTCSGLWPSQHAAIIWGGGNAPACAFSENLWISLPLECLLTKHRKNNNCAVVEVKEGGGGGGGGVGKWPECMPCGREEPGLSLEITPPYHSSLTLATSIWKRSPLEKKYISKNCCAI